MIACFGVVVIVLGLNQYSWVCLCSCWFALAGVVMWELFSNAMTPYPGLTNADVIEKVHSGYRMRVPQSMHARLASLMFHCFQHEPENRPCFSELFPLLVTQATSIFRQQSETDDAEDDAGDVGFNSDILRYAQPDRKGSFYSAVATDDNDAMNRLYSNPTMSISNDGVQQSHMSISNDGEKMNVAANDPAGTDMPTSQYTIPHWNSQTTAIRSEAGNPAPSNATAEVTYVAPSMTTPTQPAYAVPLSQTTAIRSEAGTPALLPAHPSNAAVEVAYVIPSRTTSTQPMYAVPLSQINTENENALNSRFNITHV
jgi:hypothetical protein